MLIPAKSTCPHPWP